jgi:hypothetical protein
MSSSITGYRQVCVCVCVCVLAVCRRMLSYFYQEVRTLVTLKYRCICTTVIKLNKFQHFKCLKTTHYKITRIKDEQNKPNNGELKTKNNRRKEQEQNPSETDAMVNIGTPCSSLHQILNYRLFPICRFTDEVGNMQHILKPTLQLHLRRLPRCPPELPEAIATLFTQQIYIIWHMSCRIFHSQDHALWCRDIWLRPPASLC